MAFLTLIILLPFLLQTALGQSQATSNDCRCGGKYANGKAVSGCINDRCTLTANTKCVVIYRDQAPIGYDCLPWPVNVANCATFDDGSRVCANDTCKPPILGADKSDCAAPADDGHHALLAGQVSTDGLNFVMAAIKDQVETIVKNLSIPDQKLQQSGFDIKVTNIKIAQFVSPAFTYVLLPPSSIKIYVKGGDFKVCATWEAKKSIINPGGDICVWSEKQKGVDVTVTAKVTINDLGQLRLTTSDCSLKVPIDMKLTGMLGSMLNMASSWIENTVENQAGVQICKLLDNAVKTTVAGILDELPKSFKINDMYGLRYTFRGITFHDGGVRAQIGANATIGQSTRRVFVPLMEE